MRSSLLLLAAVGLLVAAFQPALVQAFTPRREELTATGGVPDPTTDCHSDHSSTVWMVSRSNGNNSESGEFKQQVAQANAPLARPLSQCISTVLVLGMSPALALFEAGMLRSKSTVSLITQIFAGVITLSVMWICIGFTLTFGPDQGGIIGNFDYAFYIDVSYSDCAPYAKDIPHALFATFQMMFAVITPLLMTGSFAERMKFKSYLLFIVLWQIVVYYPLAHSIWGHGLMGNWGVLDFAGGIVIHTSAGIGSLVTALYMGRRKHFYDFMGEFPPSNLPLAATGAALLWIGWFGFNGGSALASGPVAVSAIVSTQVGCSCGAFMWLVLSWWKEKPQAVALMNGALAGLAGITPASGYINTPASILMGCIFGIASFYSVVLMKHHLHVDDALDVSSVHGLTGVLGALAIGLFAQTAIDPAAANGAFYGNPAQLGKQVVGVLITLIWAGSMTYVLLRIIDKLHGGIRANDDEEEIGLDWSEHHEIAYHKLHVLDDTSVAEQPLYHGHQSQHANDGHGSPLNASLLDGSAPTSDGTDVALSNVALSTSHYGTVTSSVSPPTTRTQSPSRRVLGLPTSNGYKRQAAAH